MFSKLGVVVFEELCYDRCMTERYWYLSEHKSQLGPFDQAGIQELIHQEELHGKVRLRKEGHSDWLPLQNYPEFHLPEHLYPLNLPILPMPLVETAKPTAATALSDLQEDLVEKEQEELGTPALEHLIQTEPFSEDDWEDDSTSLVLPKILKLVAALAFFVLLSGGGLYFLAQQDTAFPRPEGMRLQDYDRLRLTAEQPLQAGLQVAYAFSQDLSRVWMSSNAATTGKLNLRLTSVAGKVLTEETIRLESQSYYQKHFAEFTTFQFKQGKRLVPGFYEFEVQGQDLQLPTSLKLWRTMSASSAEPVDQLEHRSEQLYSMVQSKLFAKKLTRYQQQKREKKHEHVRELMIKYQALAGLSSQIREALENALKQPAQVGAKQFEQTYTQRFGGFLTSFILDNENLAHKLGVKFQEVAKEVKILTTLAQRMARFSMVSLDQLEKYQSPQQKKGIETSIKAELASIHQTLKLEEAKLAKRFLSSM